MHIMINIAKKRIGTEDSRVKKKNAKEVLFTKLQAY